MIDDVIKGKLIAYLSALDITPDDDGWDIEMRMGNYDSDFGKIKVCTGASKICFIFSELPFVIKWNTGSYDEAMKEVSIYKAAVAMGLDIFFPQTEFLYQNNGVSFVVQEKIDCSANEICFDSDYRRFINRVTKTPTERIVNKMQESFRKVDTYFNRTLDIDWAKTIISLYGKKKAKALCAFIIKYKINDLHADNVGYKNFRPILLDFSGYYR